MTFSHGDSDVAEKPEEVTPNGQDSVLNSIIDRVMLRLRDSDQFDEVHVQEIQELMTSGRVTSSNGLLPILLRETTTKQ